MNHPKNLQPLPHYLNASKGSKVETETSGWVKYGKENKKISLEYRKFLKERQREVEEMIKKAIENHNRGK